MSAAPAWHKMLLASLDPSLPDKAEHSILSRGSSGAAPDDYIGQLVALAKDLGMNLVGKTMVSVGLGHHSTELLAFAETVPEMGQAIGVEVIGEFVQEIAEAILQFHPELQEKVRLYHADATNMQNIESNTASLLSGVGIVLPKNARQAVQEIIRVLEPGGLAGLMLDLYDNPAVDSEMRAIREALDSAGNVRIWVGREDLHIIFQKSSNLADRLPLRAA